MSDQTVDLFSFEEGAETMAHAISNYLINLIDSGDMDDRELRLLENILSHIENDLDSAALPR